MRDRFAHSTLIIGVAAAALSIAFAAAGTAASAQTPAPSDPALKTPWGEPDLQGIWTDENDTPFQRSPDMRTRNFSPRRSAPKSISGARSAARPRRARGRGSELDVAGAYNAVWGS